MDKNRLYYGDNYDILREHIAPESADLVYLDPPFNSKRNYNIIYDGATAQAEAFKDTWSLQSWQDECQLIFEGDAQRYRRIHSVIEGLKKFVLPGNPSLFGYLVMMAIRLVELHRVLKPTGSIYLHCDPTASHYLKVVMDAVFGYDNFKNEIIWKRTSAHNDAGRYGANVDIILFAAKTKDWKWNQLFSPHDPEYIRRFKHQDADGRLWTDDNLTAKGLAGGGYEYEYKGTKSYWRCPPETMTRLDQEGKLHFTKKGGIRLKRYLDETKGVVLQCLWDDVPPINSQAAERLGYPTQKPEALLDRIIRASSNEGDLVLDPFCGCGTTVAVAQRLNRRWIGIDITFLAVDLIRQRLLDHYYRGETGLNEADAKKQFDRDIEIFGIPRDLEGARQLAAKTAGDRVRKEFEKWAVFSVKGVYSEVKGADAGMDGYFYINEIDEDNKVKPLKCPIQVKSGHVNVGDIRDFSRVIEREEAPLGVFVTLEEATRPMRDEIARMPKARLRIVEHEYDKIIIVQVQDILDGKLPSLPIQRATRRAGRVVKNEQGQLFKEET